jgi:DNA-binding NarL/FixJ family response regulator
LGEALRVLAETPIDLMVCRVTASDGDGVEFMGRVWKERRIPSIAFAGDCGNQTRAARLAPDAVRGVLSIPFHLPVMLRAIATARDRSAQRVGICQDCQGKGSVLLLTSTRECRTCRGTGLG